MQLIFNFILTEVLKNCYSINFIQYKNMHLIPIPSCKPIII